MNLKTANTFTIATGIASLSVVGRSGTASAGSFIDEANRPTIRNAGATTQWKILGGSSGSISATASTNAWHTGQGVGTNVATTSVLNVDGTEVTGTITSAANTAQNTIITGDNTNTQLLGEAEFADNVAWSSTIRGKLCANQAAYYGTTVGATCS